MRQLLLLGLFTLIGLFGTFPVAQAQKMTFAWSDKAIYDAWEPKYTNTITFTATVSGLYDARVDELLYHKHSRCMQSSWNRDKSRHNPKFRSV